MVLVAAQRLRLLWGMITGIGGALTLLFVPGLTAVFAWPAINLISLFRDGPPATVNLDLAAFPMLLVISLVGTIIGTYATPPEREEVLVNFYMRTRPWGWWGPIREAAIRRDPGFQPNREFGWDVSNVVIGIVWQTAFVALPIYFVIREWTAVGVCVTTILVTSAILKYTWYDRLQDN